MRNYFPLPPNGCPIKILPAVCLATLRLSSRLPRTTLGCHTPPVNAELQQALIQLDFARATELLRAGADINARNQYGESLLRVVMSPICDATERRALVTFMLQHGADPRLVSPDGSGPLFCAVLGQDTAVLRLLLDHGANPNREPADGETLYEYAEFDYRHETYDLKLPEEPTEADRATENAWLQFLDRLALKHGRRRPDHLILLRERGALTTDEQQQPPAKP